MEDEKKQLEAKVAELERLLAKYEPTPTPTPVEPSTTPTAPVEPSTPTPDAYDEHAAKTEANPYLAAQALANPAASRRVIDALLARHAPKMAASPPAENLHRAEWQRLQQSDKRAAAEYMRKHAIQILKK